MCQEGLEPYDEDEATMGQAPVTPGPLTVEMEPAPAVATSDPDDAVEPMIAAPEIVEINVTEPAPIEMASAQADSTQVEPGPSKAQPNPIPDPGPTPEASPEPEPEPEPAVFTPGRVARLHHGRVEPRRVRGG